MKRTLFAGLLAGISFHSSAQTLDQAIQATDREQFESATASFKKLLAGSPTDGQAWFFMGENYWANDRPDSAEACYRRGLDVNPNLPLNHVGLGKVLFAKGVPSTAAGAQLQEAQAQREEAIAKLNKAIAMAEDKAAKHPKELKAITYREVAEAYGSGPNPDIPTAITMLDKGLALVPTDADSYVVKGDLLLAKGSFDASDAIAAYKRAAELMPNAARPIAKKAEMYYRAKNYEAAIAEYDLAITMDPSFAPAYSGRAEAHFMTKSVEKATADYNKYLELNTGNTSARVRYAKFLYLTGKHAESLGEIQSLEAAGVKDNSLTRIEGYAQGALEENLKAYATMQEYFALQPQEKLIPSDYEVMGKIYDGLSKQAAADSTIRPSLPPGNLDSLGAEMYLTTARMDRTKGDLYTEAAAMFRKAKLYDMEVRTYQEKMAAGGIKVNDYYYLGSAANKAKLYSTADSAWTAYIEKQPNLFQGYLGRARANVGMDPDKVTWQAKPFYEEVVRKMKPEEQAKYKVELEEAYFYLGFYFFSSAKDKGTAKCWFEKLKELNAGTSNTKMGNDMLLNLKDEGTKDCTLPVQ
ncbi:MAG: tetratricopeptide repeat protein [Flavobacteriales bacterium]|nr:tetratricopeptide repeat protein [Flavobacteriales bacterium]